MSNHDNRIRGRYFNFQLRRNFPSGVYCVLVRSYHTGTEDYTLYAVEVTEPGSDTATAKRLRRDGVAPGTTGPASDVDYFRLDFTEAT